MESIILKSIKEFEDTLNKGKVFLYGAGKVCRTTLVWLSKHNIMVHAIFVTDKKSNPTSVYGVPVYDLVENDIQEDECYLYIATHENLHEEILSCIQDYTFKHVYAFSDRLIENMLYDTVENNMDVEDRIKELRDDISALSLKFGDFVKCMSRFFPQPRLQYFVLSILDHCNLNCAGCNHLSSLADKHYVSLKSITRDLEQMYRIHGDIPRIGIMGGEPLLHPELPMILKEARKIFKKTELLLSTNGILCNQMDEKFWSICKDYDITIRFTKYPIQIDYGEIISKIKKMGVKVDFFGTEDSVVDYFNSVAFDVRGVQSPFESFFQCDFANRCMVVEEGKMYPCPIIQNAKYFSREFNVEMPLEENDVIDIYSLDREQVMTRLANPSPFCRFCDVDSRKNKYMKWTVTQRSITEWT